MSETGWTCRQCKASVAGPYAVCASCGDKPERHTRTRKITLTGTGYDPALGRSVRDPTLPESREERVRRMVPDPTTWPGGRLHMKRIIGPSTGSGQAESIPSFGVLSYPTEYPTGYYAIDIAHDGPGYDRQIYPSIDALLEAGWRVD